MFGKINSPTPKFELLKKTSTYEIRRYPSLIKAEISSVDMGSIEEHEAKSFRMLASYIGVFGDPQNVAPTEVRLSS